MAVYKLQFNDASIIQAYALCHPDIKHTDAPSEMDLCILRKRLKDPTKFKGEVEMISLIWLRNKIVALRKAGKLK